MHEIMRRFQHIFLITLSVFVTACGSKEGPDKTDTTSGIAGLTFPDFSADSAYAFIAEQVAFGPRIPNSEAHRKTGDYLVAKLKGYGAQVTEQTFEATAYTGAKLSLRNIIGSFYPEKTKRILLAAHWDTRPFADKDPENPGSPFDGANDGASGVGVALEIARLLSASPPPNVGVDIIFFDGEDYGQPGGAESTWALGSQHWSRNKHASGYTAYYGILFDMVGAGNAQFRREGASEQYAPRIVDKVWLMASALGYSHVFVNQQEPEIMDDHVPVNEIAKIPMIDVVHFDPAIGYFGDFHHSQKDNLSVINKKTLEAVGSTVTAVLYAE